MRHATCRKCGCRSPLGDSFLLDEECFCHSCAEEMASAESSTADRLLRQLDPTLCVRCQSDNGELDWPTVAQLPVCTICEAFLRNRPYPVWLKIALAACLALAVFSVAHNGRFWSGYREIRQASRAFGNGDIDEAARLAEAARGHVPESREIAATAGLFRGIQLFAHDNAREAVPLLEQAAREFPDHEYIPNVLLQARAGLAFDDKDYDAFLAHQQELLRRHPEDPILIAGVASAWACKYALTGDSGFECEALDKLDQAAKLAGDDHRASFEEYRDRILYRLKSRRILSRQEYIREAATRPQETQP